MSWIAEYDTQGREFPTCVHMTRDAGTLTHRATYVPIEDVEAARAENAKLRELVQSFHSAMLCTLDTGMWPTDPKWLEQRMRELGVEV